MQDDADLAHGTPEMAWACAAEALDLAGDYLAAAAERLRVGDLPGNRCALRCAEAALTYGREIAALPANRRCSP